MQNKLQSSITWLIIGLIFWFIETTFFQIKFGWHWTQINSSENWCDMIAHCLIAIGILELIQLMIQVVQWIIAAQARASKIKTIIEKPKNRKGFFNRNR